MKSALAACSLSRSLVSLLQAQPAPQVRDTSALPAERGPWLRPPPGCLGSRPGGCTEQLAGRHGWITADRAGSAPPPPHRPRPATHAAAAWRVADTAPSPLVQQPLLTPTSNPAAMEKIREAFTGKSKEERATERETGHTAASMTHAQPTSGTYGEKGAYGAGGTEYTGGAAGGPAYGSAVGARGRGGGWTVGAGWALQAPAGPRSPSRALCPPSSSRQATGYTEGVTGTETRVGTVEVPVVQQVG